MVEYTYQIENGYILSLTELGGLLESMSWGDEQWSMGFNNPNVDCDRTMVAISYSNPVYTGIPNEISFQFPLMRLYSASWDSPDNTYVCIHPHMAIAQKIGLYFEDGKVKNDTLTDITVFWRNLSSALRVKIASQTDQLNVEPPSPPA